MNIMRVNTILNILERKHVLVCGKNKMLLKDLVDEVIRQITAKKAILYRIPADIKNEDEYIEYIQKTFPIVSPLGIPRSQMNFNQVWDMHLDWVSDNTENKLVVWEGIDNFTSKEWLYEIINDYVTGKYWLETKSGNHGLFRFVAMSTKNIDDYYQHAKIFLGRGEKDTRTDEEVVREHLEIVNIS